MPGINLKFFIHNKENGGITMNKKYFIFFISAVIIISIISITLVVFNNSREDHSNEKIEQEIKYLENELIGMLNSLNNISFSNSVILNSNTIKDDKSEKNSTEYAEYSVESNNILIEKNNKIDWNYLKKNAQILYSSWPTIMIELHNKNINNEDILSFSNILNNLVVSIEKENKRESLNYLAILCAYLPKYMENIANEDIIKVNTQYIKSFMVNAYVLLEDDDWDNIQNEITKSLGYINTIISSVEADNNKQNNISKIYIEINEMNNSINLKNKKLFYLKYINLMESAMRI